MEPCDVIAVEQPAPAGDSVAFSAAPGPVLKRLSDVVPREVRWLWPGRIALGKITLFVGDPGLGKSFLTCDLGGRVTRGAPWPDDPIDSWNEPADVIILNAEDGLDDTIRPRLDAAGADCARVIALEGVELVDSDTKKRAVHSFNLGRDLLRLREALERNPGTRLVIIDPVSAYLGKTDSHSNAEVRGLLAPLAALAEQTGVALVLVSHLNKGGGNKSVYRCNGSLAFPAAARAAWLVAKDPHDADRRLFLCVKNNLARDSGGLAYRIVDGRLEWEAGPVSTTADDVLGESERAGGKCASAEEWLSEYLASGPKPYKEIADDAKAAGISIGTLRRAREGLGIRPRKAGFGLGWCWSLVEDVQGAQLPPATETCAPSGAIAHLRENSVNTPHTTNTLPPREEDEDRRCAVPGGRDEVRVFDESGEPLQPPAGESR
jgi:hypothetical protein